jgi:hypothetical protein
MLAVDYGDAPDLGAGTGTGNYQTLLTDNGPRHTIVAGIKIGANLDADSGALQNATANADDVNGALPDDEDGLTNPAADLVLTIGAQPTVNVLVTNTTVTAATLYGWIDYNANGVFDNATERASVSVPTGSNNVIQTLVFPTVPFGFTGSTYARFRLSTDGAAANPTGAASDGEVEDYRARITQPSNGLAESSKTKKIASGLNGGPTLANGDKFGDSVAALGDLDGDGVPDVAVGATSESGDVSGGAVHILFMNTNGTVKSSQMIGSGIGGGPTLQTGDYFGHGVTSLGDLDGDGITDLAVGASKDDTGGYINGAVYVLFMNTNGTVKSSQKIASGIGGGPTLAFADRFGLAVAGLGDLDGDGINDLAVGAIGDDTGGTYRGAVHVLLMNANGTVKSSQKIANGIGGGPILANVDVFGIGLATLGDLDGDGVTELAVGASGDDTGGADRGAVHILFMNTNGTAKSSQKIASGVGGGPTLADGDSFGRGLAALGDLDGNGIKDLAVGAYQDDTGGISRGAVHVLLLNANGTVKGSQKIANATGGGPTLTNYDNFGVSLAALGDLDGDGLTDLMVGAERDDSGGNSRGAAYVLFLKAVTAGDYNVNGNVDAADYVLWRKMLGTNVPNGTGADGSGNGVVDQADYNVWRAHFGPSLPPGSGSSAVATVASAESTLPVSEIKIISSAPLAQISGVDPISPPSAVDARRKFSVGLSAIAHANWTAELLATVDALPKSVPNAVRPSWWPSTTVSPVVGRRSIGSRSVRRASPATVALRDSGLLAWITSTETGNRIEPAPAGWERSPGDSDPHGCSDQLEDAIDLAFASHELRFH